jgi:SNF2 family DNA or RNA helicase
VNKQKSVLKVAIYAGKDRSEILQKILDGDLDIIICSYQTLSSDWRKKLAKEEEKKEKEKENSKDDDDDDMAADDDSDDEDSGSGGSRRHPKRHIEKKSYANGGAGAKEYDDASDDDNDDESEFESDDDDDDNDDEDWDVDAQEEPCIFDLLFHRIILDEAHTIRNSKTAYFASANAIEAVHKLCITGTPFVNHPRDIHSFLSFLNVSPLNDISTFNSVVVAPIEERKEIGLARLRVVMSALAIRRTKNEVKREISLKKKTVEIREVDFPDNDPHKMCSDMLYHTCRNAFLALLQNGNQKFGQKVFLLFGLVLRVRQACASCALVPKYFRDEIESIWDDMKDANVEAMSGTEGEALYDKIVKTLKAASEKTCGIKEKKRNGSVGSDDDDENGYDDDNSVIPLKEEEEEEVKFGRSPKIQALMDAISQMKDGEKGVIFSQWTKYLDIIAEELEYENHSFGRLNGKMNMENRIESMENFAKDSGPRFLLCSLTACGTGITLTRANHVYMMDTWW